MPKILPFCGCCGEKIMETPAFDKDLDSIVCADCKPRLDKAVGFLAKAKLKTCIPEPL